MVEHFSYEKQHHLMTQTSKQFLTSPHCTGPKVFLPKCFCIPMLLCHRLHDLEECEGFKRKSMDERKSFLTNKFFGCCKENPFSRSCRKKRDDKSNWLHPTLLQENCFPCSTITSKQTPNEMSTTCVPMLHRTVTKMRISYCKLYFLSK